MRYPRIALFDEDGHATAEGWATYQKRPMFRFRIRCALGHHAWPLRKPYPPNGHSPSNFDRCTRCLAWVSWYVDGQHRWGGLDRYFSDLSV